MIEYYILAIIFTCIIVIVFFIRLGVSSHSSEQNLEDDQKPIKNSLEIKAESSSFEKFLTNFFMSLGDSKYSFLVLDK